MILAAALSFTMGTAAQNPTATISNGQLTATLYLPDAKNGFYRGTRFDWSGVVSSLEYKGHNYIGTWYQASDPGVLDFEYRGDQIVTGPCSTMIGVPEEFLTIPNKTAFGWEEAKAGGTFVKIGVGVLRKPDDKPYDHARLYPIVDGGKWTVKRKADSIEFTQTVNDSESGYGYIYSKRVTLVPGKAQMTIEHTLRNTGSHPILGEVYDHNFTRWDNETPNPDYSMSFAFDPKVGEPLGNMPLAINGRTVTFTRALSDRDAVRARPEGFGPDAKDYDFRFENKKLGIGLRATADKPLAHATIWSIRSVFAIEPFISLNIQPGSESNWKLTYDAYTLPVSGK
jgi:hypothetical protein